MRLHFSGRVRLGGTALLPSDRLYSALCWGLRECWGKGAVAEYCAAALSGEPPWIVSSAFPFCDDVDYLPKPLLPLPEGADPELGRELKRMRWIPAAAFRAWCAGQAPDTAHLRAARGLLAAALTEESSAHVALDRVSAAPALHHLEAISFRGASGLRFLLALRDPAWADFLRGALRVLEDSGLGGRRSAGYGAFRAEVRPAPEDGDGWGEPASGPWCLLSRLSPAPPEARALLEEAGFGFVDVGGWIGDGTVRRRRLRLLTEGSTFRRWDPGRWVDVTPAGWTEHPVYRGGFAFAVPLGVWR